MNYLYLQDHTEIKDQMDNKVPQETRETQVYIVY